MSLSTQSAVTNPTLKPTSSSSTFSRYLVVTAVATPTNLVLYALLLRFTALHPTVTNLIAATLVTIPTFFVNRSWVWRVSAPVAGQAIAYWMTTLVNVGCSSAAILVLNHFEASDALLVWVPLGIYTAMWAARFFFLDRILFKSPTG